MIFFAHS